VWVTGVTRITGAVWVTGVAEVTGAVWMCPRNTVNENTEFRFCA